jgi:hypothetical protein
MPQDWESAMCRALDAAVDRDAVFDTMVVAYHSGNRKAFDAAADNWTTWLDNVSIPLMETPAWPPGSALDLAESELDALEGIAVVAMSAAWNGDQRAVADLPMYLARIDARQQVVIDQRERLRGQYGLDC